MKSIKVSGNIIVKCKYDDPYNHYEAIKTLGEGTYGKVLKVRHKISNVIRAMKIISKFGKNNKRKKEDSYLTEIKVLKSVDHSNIIKIYEYFETEYKLFIVEELCEGGQLFDLMIDPPYVSERSCMNIMRQILSAVRFLHANGVVHRDLKLENILVVDKELPKDEIEIKIIDNETFYCPAVVDQNDGESVLFKLTSTDPTKLVFENAQHDFPKKICYYQEGNNINASIEGNGKKIPFYMKGI
jgi:serine/threonine protein kinase